MTEPPEQNTSGTFGALNEQKKEESEVLPSLSQA